MTDALSLTESYPLPDPAPLFARLDALGIAHTTLRHPPTATVAEGKDIKAALPGGHSKNLFMKDKDGTLVLISALAEADLRLNQLHKEIGTKRLSFTGPDLLHASLGVWPGSVCAFALMNDVQGRVRFILDRSFLAHETVYFHPLRNDMTTGISPEGLIRFARDTGHPPVLFDPASL